MGKKKIPENIREQADGIIERFNKAYGGSNHYYITRYGGSYLYLDRNDYGVISNICRLKYKGDVNNWDFAIFKYSSERYDPEEWFFPGEEHVDGTIEGAMRAGLEAYP